jgi:hypothetical protein
VYLRICPNLSILAGLQVLFQASCLDFNVLRSTVLFAYCRILTGRNFSPTSVSVNWHTCTEPLLNPFYSHVWYAHYTLLFLIACACTYSYVHKVHGYVILFSLYIHYIHLIMRNKFIVFQVKVFIECNTVQLPHNCGAIQEVVVLNIKFLLLRSVLLIYYWSETSFFKRRVPTIPRIKIMLT